MESKEIKIKVYKIKENGKIYNIYVNTIEHFIEFYIQEEGNGIISFEVGLTLETLTTTIEQFIRLNIHEWAIYYQEQFGD